MKYSEIARTRYFHGSQKNFDIGTILTPQKDGYVLGSDISDGDIEKDAHLSLERAIEQYRPTNAVPRAKAVFMVTHPDDIDYAGGYTDNIYEVVPLGPVSKANLHWYSELNAYLFDSENIDPDHVKKLALQYWNATPSKHALYEYMTPAARVIDIIESDDD